MLATRSPFSIPLAEAGPIEHATEASANSPVSTTARADIPNPQSTDGTSTPCAPDITARLAVEPDHDPSPTPFHHALPTTMSSADTDSVAGRQNPDVAYAMLAQEQTVGPSSPRPEARASSCGGDFVIEVDTVDCSGDQSARAMASSVAEDSARDLTGNQEEQISKAQTAGEELERLDSFDGDTPSAADRGSEDELADGNRSVESSNNRTTNVTIDAFALPSDAEMQERVSMSSSSQGRTADLPGMDAEPPDDPNSARETTALPDSLPVCSAAELFVSHDQTENLPGACVEVSLDMTARDGEGNVSET